MKYAAAPHSRMSIRDFKNLVKTGEGTYLEFKRTIPSPHKIAREMAAFANTLGGTLLVGVDDDKSLIGVPSYHEQVFLLEQAAFELCVPAINYSMEILPYNYRDIVIVKIKEAEKKPVVVQYNGREEVFVRLKDKSIRASTEKVSILRHQASGQGVVFEYGPYEQKLFRYLGEYERITVNEFSNLVHIPHRKASNILVNLVNAGILLFFNNTRYDYFTMAQEIAG